MDDESKVQNLFLNLSEHNICSICGINGNEKYSGVKDVLFNVPGEWSLYYCNNCGLVWLRPKPSLEQIASFYDNYHTHDDYDESALVVRIFSRGIPSATLGYNKLVSSKIERIIGFILSLVGPFREGGQGSVLWLHAMDRGRLLDVGCGSGIFLRRLGSLGWDTWGIEFDPEASKHAMSGLEPGRVYTGRIEECSFENDYFDVITMNHVIEHLSDPISALKKCMKLLKPGGKLVISTPNANSLGARFFKRYWRGWEPPRHLYIYNPGSLSKLMTMSGFDIKEIFTPTNATPLIWNESFKVKAMNTGVVPGRLCAATIFVAKIFAWLFEYFAVRLGSSSGELIHCVAKKPLKG